MNWNDFIANTNWGFWGVIVAVIFGLATTTIAIIAYIKSQKKKSLSYEVTTETDLISVHEEAKGRLKILFDDNLVEDVKLLIISVINDGNIPIIPDDFTENLTFKFDEKTNLLTTEIIESSEKSLIPKLNTDNNQISLEPTLLNPNDIFSFKVLLTNYEKEFEVNARIIGVQNVSKYERKDYFSIISLPILIAFYAFGLLVVYLINPINTNQKLTPLLISIGLFFLSISLLVLFLAFPSLGKKASNNVLSNILGRYGIKIKL